MRTILTILLVVPGIFLILVGYPAVAFSLLGLAVVLILTDIRSDIQDILELQKAEIQDAVENTEEISKS